jgi:spore coat protein A
MSGTMSRRRLTPRRLWALPLAAALVVPALAPVAGAAPPPPRPATPMFVDPLPVIGSGVDVIDATDPRADTDGDDGTFSFGLDEVVGSHRFSSQLTGATPSFGYVRQGTTPSDVYLGPLVVAKRDVPVAMTVTNKLTSPNGLRPDGTPIHPYAAWMDPTLPGYDGGLDRYAAKAAVHLHGGHVPPADDGGPMDWFRPAGIDTTEFPPSTSPDGYPDPYHDDYADGTGSFTYRYPNDQQAATLWYHDHGLGSTRFTPAAGLAGGYLIRDEFDTGVPATGVAGGPSELGLPTVPYEQPLVLQDKAFADPSGAIAYPEMTTAAHPTWAPEAFGDVAVINGTAWPRYDVDRGVYRFHIVNGANARVFRLSLFDLTTGSISTAAPMYQIGDDGGMLNAPVRISKDLVVAPGQRVDLLVDFSQAPPNRRYELRNSAPTPYPDGKRQGLNAVALTKVMQFVVGTGTGGTTTVPAVLRDGQQITVPGPDGTTRSFERAAALEPAPSAGLPRRNVFLNEVLDPAGAPTAVLLNNLPFEEDEGVMRDTLIPDPAVDTAEVWQIVNTTVDAHPVHLHLVQFRVLDRQMMDTRGYLAAVNPALPFAEGGTGVLGNAQPGTDGNPSPDAFLRGPRRAPATDEQGWMDTVVANPGEVLRIVVPFGGSEAESMAPFAPPYTASRTGTYVWHCHILEHEENDMMQPYVVRP